MSHGNPTLVIGESPADRLRIERVHDGRLVWRSHGLAPGTDAVRVDAHHGDFAGPLAGGSVLPEGQYRYTWEPDGSDAASFNVAEQTLFDFDLTSVSADQLRDTRPWQACGRWKPGSKGLGVASDAAYLFADGEMHGELRAQFVLDSPPNGDVSWGLIARHYNAFAHVRLECRGGPDALRLRLVRAEGTAENQACATVAEGQVRRGQGPTELVWNLNGSKQQVCVDGAVVLEADEGFMGGVTIVGLFATAESVHWRRWSMTTTQPVPRHTVKRDAYRAVLRPGNVSVLQLLESGAPDQNLFWESGIQFGHIGGSELKFTQDARQQVVAAGPVATTVTWQGPMPKFFDQSRDIRGVARGQVNFYPDRIVIADEVLTWVRRSVGPDFDLLGRIMAGPARIALAGKRSFRPWTLPATGDTQRMRHKAMPFPAAAAFPFDLAGSRWWLLAVIDLRYPADANLPTSLFAWQCPRGLTASHDFRVAPTTPGIEYAYSILVSWCRGEDDPEQVVLNLRDDWTAPMGVEAVVGRTVTYDPTLEQPREAIDFNGCFDRASGRYVVAADGGAVNVKLDPGTVPRRAAGFTIRNWPADAKPLCTLDGRTARNGDVLAQPARHDELWLWLNRRLDGPVELAVRSEE